jgi:type II secretory pathway pseudopilin PulG
MPPFAELKAPPRDAGFLLLEALVGLVILGTVVLALLAATASQVRSADKASVLLVSGALAQDRLSALQLQGYDQLMRLPDSLASGQFAPPFDEFSWQATVAPAGDEYELFSLLVVVEGRGERLPLETLVHRTPPTAGAVGGE